MRPHLHNGQGQAAVEQVRGDEFPESNPLAEFVKNPAGGTSHQIKGRKRLVFEGAARAMRLYQPLASRKTTRKRS